MIKKVIKKIFSIFNYRIENKLNQTINRDFFNLSTAIKEKATMTSAEYILKNFVNAKEFSSRFQLYDFIIENNLITTQFLEFGVYKGESINYFSKSLQNIDFIGFDSFEGLPEDWRTGFERGEFSLEGSLPRVNSNVKLIKGWFSDSLPLFLEKETALKNNIFIHIDCDIYSSTKFVFDQLYKYLKGDIYILFDEYFNYPFWEFHEFKAFQEFVKSNSIKYEYIAYNVDHEQVLIKLFL
jgi:hypothetical protein